MNHLISVTGLLTLLATGATVEANSGSGGDIYVVQGSVDGGVAGQDSDDGALDCKSVEDNGMKKSTIPDHNATERAVLAGVGIVSAGLGTLMGGGGLYILKGTDSAHHRYRVAALSEIHGDLGKDAPKNATTIPDMKKIMKELKQDRTLPISVEDYDKDVTAILGAVSSFAKPKDNTYEDFVPEAKKLLLTTLAAHENHKVFKKDGADVLKKGNIMFNSIINRAVAERAPQAVFVRDMGTLAKACFLTVMADKAATPTTGKDFTPSPFPGFKSTDKPEAECSQAKEGSPVDSGAETKKIENPTESNIGKQQEVKQPTTASQEACSPVTPEQPSNPTGDNTVSPC